MKHVDSKIMNMSIAYTLPTEAPIWPNASKFTQSTSSQPTHAPTSSQHIDIQHHDDDNPPSTPHDDDSPPLVDDSPPLVDDDNILINPEPENEFVGVDEENMYLSIASTPGASHHVHVSESESDFDKDYEEEDGLVGEDPVQPLIVAYDKGDPPMCVGRTYPNMAEFKLALSYYAIKHEFEYDTEKSDPGRMILYCSRKLEDGCRWRLYASTMDDKVSIQVRKNPRAHTCSSARRSKVVKHATKFWVCDVVKDWLSEDSRWGAKQLQAKIKEKYKVEVPYKRVYIGKYRGQLACACAVDGHNWMYPVAFGVFDSETNENWIWFMERLREAIGTPQGLAICTDAGQSVMAGVQEVFPSAEHREFMFHLVTNFKKKYTGKVFDDHLWAAAYSWSPYFFNKHWTAMDEARPDAMDYIRQWHKRIWTRSQFLTHCTVDYVTNNLVESFNNWVKRWKGLNLDDFMDKIRHLLMEKWYTRRTVSTKMGGLILPHVIKKLKEQSFNLDMDVSSSSNEIAEVCVKGSNGFKCVVNLQERTCSCRKYQVSGIPCLHAIAFITKIGQPLENYVDSYYSVEKFRVAYDSIIPALTDKSQWQQSDHGFFMHPPLPKSTAGRRKNQRFKGCTESTGSTAHKKGQHRCPICSDYGHHQRSCKNGDPNDIAAMLAERGPPNKKKKKSSEVVQQSQTETSIVAIDSSSGPIPMWFPPSSQGCPNNLSSSRTDKSACGSNQPELLTLQFPPSSSRPTQTTAAPKAEREEKHKREGKGVKEKEGKYYC